MKERTTVSVIGTPIDALSLEDAISILSEWAAERQSRYVCLCNVHSVVTAKLDDAFKGVLQHADMATPDGEPIAWMMRRMGHATQQRISGPDLMWEYLGHASTRQEPIYLIGGRPDTLEKLRLELLKEFPALKIAGTCSPPFRPLTDAETTAIIDEINASGARTVWVGLGCPKQETWMSMQKGKIHAVMFGVGAAFDFHARTTPRAPKWMQQKGLEWLFRLCSEPRRLWKRYFVTNSLFLWYAFIQLVGGKGHPPQNAR